MTMKTHEGLRRALRPAVDYAPLLELARDARFVLIGEASHGTHEFYTVRAEITRLLIEHAGFTAVAAEADWPDAYRVNRYVRRASDDADAEQALRGFRRFPAWMWRNADVVEFVEWLREHNDRLPSAAPATGFFGLDLYSLYASMEAVVSYLEHVDPEAAQRARDRYACFEHFGQDAQEYASETARGADPCERQALDQLVELRRKAAEYASLDGRVAEDRLFYAEQNARLVKNAEEYYRSMYHGRISSWNLRDRHMVETLEALARHLDRDGNRNKLVVWAHNSHIGDARATEMGNRGELNVGQLVRERHPRESVLFGFTTYSGWVTAASDWGRAAERKRVRPALDGSFEALFHDLDAGDFLLVPRDAARELAEERLQRAIGVVYRPETERWSHYFHARLPDQFDAVLHYDETRAVEPLERTAAWERGELPETYPSTL